MENRWEIRNGELEMLRVVMVGGGRDVKVSLGQNVRGIKSTILTWQLKFLFGEIVEGWEEVTIPKAPNNTPI